MLAESLRLGFRSGYKHTSYLVDRLFNIALSLLIISATFPLFFIIALVILVRDGRPILYKGKRLGFRKREFTMYKFRTLVPDADKRLGKSLLESRHHLFTSCGKFLRDTRLDELPQLFNILKGDMDFLGPRPERPEIYEYMCCNIKDYDKRFVTKPGLIGFSQVFTPHSTPKRIRATIDNRMIARKQKLFWDSYAIFLTGIVVARATLCRSIQYFTQALWQQRLRHQYHEKRELTRVRHKCATMEIRGVGAGGNETVQGRLVNINDRAFLVHIERDVEFPEAEMAVDAHPEQRFPILCTMQANWKPRAAHPKRKTARCLGRLYQKRPGPEGTTACVIEFSPASQLDYYLIHQYFLRKSMTHCTRV